MLKKTVTYDGFDGETITEDLYFNLTKAELLEMEIEAGGGLSDTLQKMVESGNNFETYQFFKKVILMAYGTRSEDGKRFYKDKMEAAAFGNTEAFSSLIFGMLGSDDGGKEAAAFVRGILPKGMSEEVEAAMTEAEHKNPGLASVPSLPVAEEEIDFDAMLEEIEETPKKPINQKQYDHMKKKLNEKQFDAFMRTRYLDV